MPETTSIQQVAEKLLAAPVFGGRSMEFWLINGLPPAIEYMEQKHYKEALPHWQALQGAFSSSPPKNFLRFDDPTFELFYRQAREHMEAHPDMPLQDAFDALSQYRSQFHKGRDFETQILDDLLPMLQRWRDKGSHNPKADRQALVTIWEQLKETSGKEGIAHFIREVPAELQPDDPQSAYQGLAVGIKDIVVLLYSQSPEWSKQMKSGTTSHYNNRLKDYWRGMQ